MDRYNENQQIIASLPTVFEAEMVELEKAFNRVLREDVFADTSMPPFNKSAMDGYACRLSDIGNELEVLEVIPAGKMPTRRIGINQCSKIMTGAAIPEGAECVFMVEDSEEMAANKVRCTNPKTKTNICLMGEDYKKGDCLMETGTLIKTSQLAVLAGAGYNKVIVSRLPRVAVITTGSELVEPHEEMVPGKIRNSNASQLLSQLVQMGLQPKYMGIAKDNFKQLVQLFTETLERFEVLFFTGGASVGDFDWIPHVLKQQSFDILWERTGMKPGNPMTLARAADRFVFGLSGNPVSSLVQFELMAKPALYKLLGANYKPVRVKTQLAGTYRRKKADRLAIAPVIINDAGEAETIDFHGSAHLNALVYAHALMEVPIGVSEINKGENVYVRPL